ncbi:MAG TPA: cupin domain-containing protein [Verrucomicrobiae bacterium]|nr:cupin domain-containing protein [Verrucomicrobiae bacterium]
MHIYKRYDSKKRMLAAPLLFFELEDEIQQLKEDPEWPARQRTAVTLVKEPELSVVLVIAQKGAALREHHTESPVTLQVLSGSVRFVAGDDTRTVARNGFIALDKGIPHEVEALEESAFLLTIIEPKH